MLVLNLLDLFTRSNLWTKIQQKQLRITNYELRIQNLEL